MMQTPLSPPAILNRKLMAALVFNDISFVSIPMYDRRFDISSYFLGISSMSLVMLATFNRHDYTFYHVKQIIDLIIHGYNRRIKYYAIYLSESYRLFQSYKK